MSGWIKCVFFILVNAASVTVTATSTTNNLHEIGGCFLWLSIVCFFCFLVMYVLFSLLFSLSFLSVLLF